MRRCPAFVVVMLLAIACGGSNQAGSAPAPESAASTGKACTASPGTADVSGWQEMAGDGFTLCAPPDWVQQGYTLRHGNASIALKVRGSQMVTVAIGPIAGMPPTGKSRLPATGDVETRNFSEVINGLRVNFSRARFDSDYFTSASWDSPKLSLSGRAGDQRAAETELTIYRTVKFTTP